MPKRTNPFQELVHLIELAFAGSGDRVTASAMEKGHGLDGEREIDIRRETSNGLYTLKVAIEAKDEGRVWDVTKVDGYIGKYQGRGSVPVDKIILVSRRGFTSGAIERAEAAGVTLLTLDKALDFDWSSAAGCAAGLHQVSVLHARIPPHIHEIRVQPPLPPGREKLILREGVVFCATCRKDQGHGTPLAYINRELGRRNEEVRELVARLEEGCRSNTGGQQIEGDIKLGAGFKIRHDGVDYPLVRLQFTIRAMNSSADLSCTPYEIGPPGGQKKTVFHLEAEIGRTRFRFLMPDGLKSKKVALNVSELTPKQRAKRRKKTKKNRGK